MNQSKKKVNTLIKLKYMITIRMTLTVYNNYEW